MVYPSIFPMAIAASASFVEGFLQAKRLQKQYKTSTLKSQEELLKTALELYPIKTYTSQNKNCNYCGRLQTLAINCEGCGAPRCV